MSSKYFAIYPLILTAIIMGLFLVISNVSATGNHNHDNDDDDCGDEYTYEKSSDYSDSKVEIDFENSDKQIDVSAKSGYSINKVWLDVDDDNHGGFHQYSTGPLNNFNPNPGNEINKAKVEVEKVCSTPSPSATATASPTVSPSATASPTASPSATPSPSASSSAQATSSPTASPTVSPTSTPTSTPAATNAPASVDSDDDDDDDDSDDASSGGPQDDSEELEDEEEGEVLGVSALAPTGSFTDTLRGLILSLGIFSTMISALLNVQKRA